MRSYGAWRILDRLKIHACSVHTKPPYLSENLKHVAVQSSVRIEQKYWTVWMKCLFKFFSRLNFIWCRLNEALGCQLGTKPLLVCTWCHSSHVGGQEQKHFSPLRTKLYFHVNYSRKKFYCIDPQYGRFLTWLQTKNWYWFAMLVELKWNLRTKLVDNV